VTVNAPMPTPTSELNATPMLDVLLVLLITFMALSIQVHQTIDVQLPEASVGEGQRSSHIVLEVLPGPTYRVNRTPVAAADLGPRLRGIYLDRPEKILYIAGDPRVRYHEVVTAMDVARSAGVTVLGITPEESRPR
jgi:biopolymer transport protein TolR